MKKAVLLLIVISNLIYNNASAQVSKADKQLIEKHIDQLNKELFLDLFKDSLVTKKKYTHEFIDSILHEYRSSYDDGHVTYAPDKKFKIFVLEGESCGGNCSSFYIGFIHLAGKNTVIHIIDLLPVTHIYKLKDNKYLVLQKGTNGGGYLIDDCLQATLLSFNGTKIIQHAIHYPKAENKSSKSLYLYQSERFAEYSKDTPVLSFDPGSERLSYKYIKSDAGVVSGNAKQAATHSGYFNYKNGAFIFRKETKSKLK